MPVQEPLTKSVESLTLYRRGWLILADADYVAARVLYYAGSFHPQVLRLCRDALEKYLKLSLLEVKGNQAPSDGEKADKYLQSFWHNLVKLCEACVSCLHEANLHPKFVTPFAGVLTHPFFVNAIKWLDSEKYETTTRYPTNLCFPGNSVQICDHVIHDVRDWFLGLAQETPLEVALRLVLPEKVGWPPLNEEMVMAAFCYHNKYFRGMLK